MRTSTSMGVGRLSLDPLASVEARGVVDTDSLLQQALETRQEIENWVNAQKSRLLAEKRDHEFTSQEHARQSSEAQRKRELLQHEHRESSANAHDQQSRVTAQEVEIEVLQGEKTKKEPVLRELFAANQQKDEQLKLLVREAEHQRSSWNEQLAELQRGLALYERLGLVFEQTNAEKIVIRFTQIDAANPVREFSFLIRIDPELDSFIGEFLLLNTEWADACEPPVEALPDLMEELNQTADFSKLVRAMRREFKQLV